MKSQSEAEGTWVLASITDDFKTEINSLEVKTGNEENTKTVKYWVKLTYLKNKEKLKGEFIKHQMELTEFDLTSKKYRRINLYVYNLKGDVIYKKDESYGDFNIVIPETVGESQYNTVIEMIAEKEVKKIYETEKYKKIAADLERGVVFADSLYNLNQLDSALMVYKNELNYLEKYSTTWQQKYYPENLPYTLLTKINNTQAEIKTNGLFKTALNKADSIYDISHEQSIQEYENCLKIKYNLSINKRIDEIKKEVELRKFKSFVLTKKTSIDSLQIIKLKNDSLIKNVIIRDREYFLQAYESLIANYNLQSKNTIYLKQYFSTKEETKIKEIDENFKNRITESQAETLAFIDIQRNIINTDYKIIKRQNKELKKTDYKVETIMTIINNRTE
jgi:hypothetical protein